MIQSEFEPDLVRWCLGVLLNFVSLNENWLIMYSSWQDSSWVFINLYASSVSVPNTSENTVVDTVTTGNLTQHVFICQCLPPKNPHNSYLVTCYICSRDKSTLNYTWQIKPFFLLFTHFICFQSPSLLSVRYYVVQYVMSHRAQCHSLINVMSIILILSGEGSHIENQLRLIHSRSVYL